MVSASMLLHAAGRKDKNQKPGGTGTCIDTLTGNCTGHQSSGLPFQADISAVASATDRI